LSYYDSRDSLKDNPTEFAYEVGQNKITLKQHDPHGFWKFQFTRGHPPDWMQGNYTAFAYAKAHLDKYLKEKGKEPVEGK
jgi:hypothetical protein